MSDIQLDENEKLIGTWTINHISPASGRVLGKLYVTDKRLLLDGKYDTSLKGMAEELLLMKFGSTTYVEIPKSDIKSVEAKSSLLKKKVIVGLKNGQEHTFDYGLLSITKLEAAIKQ